MDKELRHRKLEFSSALLWETPHFLIIMDRILCLWFRASLIYVNYSPTRYNTKQSIWPRWREVAAQKIWPVPEAVVTVLYTPDDGCSWHPKHVEWTFRIINILICVASHWTTISKIWIVYLEIADNVDMFVKA